MYTRGHNNSDIILHLWLGRTASLDNHILPHLHWLFLLHTSQSVRIPDPLGSRNTHSWSAVWPQRAALLLTWWPVSDPQAEPELSWTPTWMRSWRGRREILRSIRKNEFFFFWIVFYNKSTLWSFPIITHLYIFLTCHTQVWHFLFQAAPAYSCTPEWKVFSESSSSPGLWSWLFYKCDPWSPTVVEGKTEVEVCEIKSLFAWTELKQSCVYY